MPWPGWPAGRNSSPTKIGLAGTSLGSLVGAVVAANEPRIKNVCLMLGGGGLVDAYYDHPLARQYLPLVELAGGKAAMKALIDPIDPLTYARKLKEKNLLMICASRDDIVPPKAAEGAVGSDRQAKDHLDRLHSRGCGHAPDDHVERDDRPRQRREEVGASSHHQRSSFTSRGVSHVHAVLDGRRGRAVHYRARTGPKRRAQKGQRRRGGDHRDAALESGAIE